MKKLMTIVMFTILVGSISSCSSNVPEQAFRIQTRKKFHLLGIPLPFSVRLPFVSINLKTSTMAGAPGTLGTATEFNPGGQYVNTGLNANFDAVQAVLPAPWVVKAAPNQTHCANSSPTTYSAVAGTKYNFRCNLNINVQFLVSPSLVDLTDEQATPPESLDGNGNKGSGIFQANQNLTVQYYKQIGHSEEYELIDEKPVLSVINGGRDFTFSMPDTDQTRGYVHYRVLVIDNDYRDIYLAHGEFSVVYPLIVDPPPPNY